MNDLLQDTNGYVTAFDQLMQRLHPENDCWLHSLRQDALSSFLRQGFPTTRQEAWRFTNVAPISKIPFKPANPSLNRLTISDISPYTVCEARCTQIVFLNGFYSESLSTVKYLPKGVQMCSLAEALTHTSDLVKPTLDNSAGYQNNAFIALNTAFMSDGAFVYIPSGTCIKDPIHLLFLSTSHPDPAFATPRNLVLVENNSQVSIVESYAGLGASQYFTNSVTDISVGTNSSVDHYRLQRESDIAFHISSTRVTQAKDSNYISHSLSLGGSLVRSSLDVTLDGNGASCDLNGLYVAKGEQHVDHHTSIDHTKPNCTSRELYKGILDDSSSAVFNGRIIVRKDAQKTNARQANKNLLLSKNSTINTAPQLEILADDVKCTHGATIGQLNEDELFYLRSRGIERNAARTLLTYAFATELLSTVKIKPIQCQIDLVLLNRLARSQ